MLNDRNSRCKSWHGLFFGWGRIWIGIVWEMGNARLNSDVEPAKTKKRGRKRAKELFFEEGRKKSKLNDQPRVNIQSSSGEKW